MNVRIWPRLIEYHAQSSVFARPYSARLLAAGLLLKGDSFINLLSAWLVSIAPFNRGGMLDADGILTVHLLHHRGRSPLKQT